MAAAQFPRKRVDRSARAKAPSMRPTTDAQSAPAAISSKWPAQSGATSATAIVMMSNRMNRIARVAIARAHAGDNRRRAGQEQHDGIASPAMTAATTAEIDAATADTRPTAMARSCVRQSSLAATPPTSRLPTAMARPSGSSPRAAPSKIGAAIPMADPKISTQSVLFSSDQRKTLTRCVLASVGFMTQKSHIAAG
jgi:hypothetical protein